MSECIVAQTAKSEGAREAKQRRTLARIWIERRTERRRELNLETLEYLARIGKHFVDMASINHIVRAATRVLESKISQQECCQ